jgi:hypothetical protein
MCAKLFANLSVLDVSHEGDHVRIVERRFNGREIDSHHPPLSAHRSGGLLEPAPGPTAEVRNPLAGLENPMAALELGQLVDRARAKTLAFGPLVEMVLAIVAGDGAAT